MDKTVLLSELHAIIASRLHGQWLVKGETQLPSALRALDLVLRGENQGAGGGASHRPKKPRPMSLGDEINFCWECLKTNGEAELSKGEALRGRARPSPRNKERLHPFFKCVCELL